jgi:cell shape-determining protein MreC
MKSLKEIIILILIVAIFIVVIFFRGAFNNIYQKTKVSLSGSDSKVISSNDYNQLLRENQRLKFELEKYQAEAEEKVKEGVIAKVYSRYPFNDKERIIINLGKEDNIKLNAPVLTKDGFLLGKVVVVRSNQSEIETIFDVEWKSSVAVKEIENKAVMEGGQPPKLKLLSKEAEINEGDSVFNITPDFPYQKLIGEVKEIKDITDEIWRTSSVKVQYNLDEINEVVVFVNWQT